MKKIFYIILLVSILCFSVYPLQAKQVKQEKSVLEKRDVQTHYFDTTDKNKVMKAVANTLQDNGFIIQKIDDNLGFIKAKKEIKAKRTNKAYAGILKTSIVANALCILINPLDPTSYIDLADSSIRVKNETDPHTVIFILNASVETVGKQTKVRLSIIEEEKENADGYSAVKASTRNVKRHYEDDTYQDMFRQIDKNLFIEKI